MKPKISVSEIVKQSSIILLSKITDFKLAEQGADHIVILVKCANGNSYVIKAGPEAHIDAFVLKKLFPKAIKVPKVISESSIKINGTTYPLLIMTLFEGKLLRSLPPEKRIDFIKPVIKEINKVHELVTLPKAGLLADVIKKKGLSWKEYLKRDLQGKTKYFNWEEICQRKGVDKRLVLRGLRVALEKIETVPEDRPIVLLHGDLNDSNIFIKDNQLEGIVDWSDALYGDPLFDFARFRMNIDHQIGSEGVKTYYGVLKLSSKLLDLEKLYFLFHILVYVNWYSFDNNTELVQRHMGILQKLL